MQRDRSPESSPEEQRHSLQTLALVATPLVLGAVLVAGAIEFAQWLHSGTVAIPGDGDPYVRLVRVRELLASGDWGSRAIPGAHLGQPEVVAWSRPLDVLILALVMPLRLVLPADTALLLGGSLVSPLLLAACVPLMIAALRALALGPFGAACGLLAFLCQPLILPAFAFGRADHHALLMLCLIAFTASFLRLLDGQRGRRGLWCGAIAGAGVWVNPEFTLFPAIAGASLVLAWCRGDDASARRLSDLAAGAAAIALLAILCEAGASGFTAVQHDRVSIVHLALFGAAFAMGRSMARPHWHDAAFAARACFAGAAGALTLAALALAFPGFQRGPANAMDPRLGPIWFENLYQSQSLFRTDVKSGHQYVAVAATMLAVAVPTLLLWRRRQDDTGRRRADFLLLAVLACCGLTAAFRRTAPILAFFCALPVGILCDLAFRSVQQWRLPRGSRLARLRRVLALESAVFLAAMAPHLTLSAADALVGREGAAAPAVTAACHDELQQWIQRGRIAELTGRQEGLVVARPEHAPALLFWTRHGVLAWNHHRSLEGLTQLRDWFRARDEADLRRVIEPTGAAFVLYCPSRSPAETYWRADGPAPLPGWLDVVAGEREGPGPVLLEIDRDAVVAARG